MMGGWGGRGGGSDKGSYFTHKNITTSEFVYPKKSLPFLAYPKKSLYFFPTQKFLASFIDPKKITFGQKFRPKKITRTPPSLKYVSGTPGSLRAMFGIYNVAFFNYSRVSLFSR